MKIFEVIAEIEVLDKKFRKLKLVA